MTIKEIGITLNLLQDTIELKKHELGISDDKIRVRMGICLSTKIRQMYGLMMLPVSDEISTIFGYPVEIEHEDDMCLEVHIVEKVPICKAGELNE